MVEKFKIRSTKTKQKVWNRISAFFTSVTLFNVFTVVPSDPFIRPRSNRHPVTSQPIAPNDPNPNPFQGTFLPRKFGSPGTTPLTPHHLTPRHRGALSGALGERAERQWQPEASKLKRGEWHERCRGLCSSFVVHCDQGCSPHALAMSLRSSLRVRSARDSTDVEELESLLR